MTQNPFFKALFAATFVFFLSACATTSPNSTDEEYDPWEKMNRATYKFNKAIDKAIYNPVTKTYRAVVPEVPRQGVSNVVRNLREPWILVNDILQLKFKRAARTLSRFVINSSIGMGGLFKVSEKMDIPYHSEDLGQTMATWGVGDGPYFIIPFIGPSSTRDTTGFAAFIFADPVTIGISKTNIKGLNLTRTGVDALDARSRAHDLINSVYDDPDGYELMRSSYRQKRIFDIHDGNPPEADADIFDDLEDEEEAEMEDKPEDRE